jgi:starch synthase
MKILIAASNLAPLISDDPIALARAIPALAVALQRAGNEVSLAGPLDPALEQSPLLKLKRTGVKIAVPLGNDRLTADVLEARSPQGLQLFLFAHERLAEMGAAGAALFSKLIVELSRRLSPPPDIVQIADWPGAMAPVFFQAQHLPFTSVLSVRDPVAQGSFPIEDFGLLNLGWEYFRPTGVEFYGRMNFLKAGILHASATVVEGDLEKFAIQNAPHGAGMEVVFRENAARLHGIPAGLDEQTWNPARDSFIARKYRPAALAGKATCRNVYLSHAGLDRQPEGPVFLLDLASGQDPALLGALCGLLDLLLEGNVRLTVLGNFPQDHPAYVGFAIAARKHAARLALLPKVDDRLLHLALSGSDYEIFLGRGLGLTARILRSLKYGTLPILPAGPGLRQIVSDFDPSAEAGCGLVFYQQDEAALLDVLGHRAPSVLASPDRGESARQHAMIQAAKFSWARAAANHGALYSKLGH